MKDLRRSPLEEARFGIRAGRVDEVLADDLPAICQFCRDEHIQLLVARCDAADVSAAQALEESGARLMDTLVFWERDLGKHPFEPDGQEALVRPATPADANAVLCIAGESFAGYVGHYHADPRLDRTAADAAYVDWAARSLRQEAADVVLVAEVDGLPGGFGTFRLEDDGRCNLLLTAVGVRNRRRGLHRAIVAGGLAWAAVKGARAYYSSTQIGNLAAQKSYARLGMEISGAVHTFHWWRS